MSARRTMRMPTAAKLAVGASALAFPATAVAQVPATALHSVHPLDVGYGHKTIIRGSVPTADAGEQLDLEYRPSLAGHWRTVDIGAVHHDGSFALAARLGRSGHLQVVPARPASTAPVSSQRTAE